VELDYDVSHIKGYKKKLADGTDEVGFIVLEPKSDGT
jgi:hypothetical protein